MESKYIISITWILLSIFIYFYGKKKGEDNDVLWMGALICSNIWSAS